MNVSKRTKKLTRSVVIFVVTFSWVFSGWPQIFNFPPQIQEVRAASPSVASRGTGTANATTITVTLSGTPASGNLYVIFLQSQTNSVTWSQNTGTSGWIEMYDSGGQAAYYKQIGTSEPNPVFLQSQNTRSGYSVLQITGHESPATQAPEAQATPATGASTTPDPPAVTPTGGSKDYLFIAVAGNNDARASYTVAPTNYANLNAFNTGGGPNGGAGATAERVLTASSEDPGTFTMGSSATWFANTIVVHPPAPVAPTVTTQAVSSIGSTSATGNGNVTADGGATVTERGVVANTTGTPTTADLKFTAASGGTGVFTASMTGLSASTHYYVRAYAINSVGTSYGSQVEFDTSAANTAPNAPSQDSPANSATGVSVTPTFTMTATDPDSDDVNYKVTIYSNSACDATVSTHDQSVTSTGWSQGTPYTSGVQGSFTLQSGDALSFSTQYWWRASAKDPSGTNTFTDSSTCNTFTTAAATISVTITANGTILYGTIVAGGSKATHSGDLNTTITAQNDGDVTETFNIKGQDTACPWTLAASSGSDQYAHQFCKTTDVSCTSPPTNYTALTTSYQTLYTSVAVSASRNIDLRVIVPDPSSCSDQQSVDIVIQAVAS